MTAAPPRKAADRDPSAYVLLEVEAVPNALGAYVCAISLGGKRVLTLNREQAAAYVTEVTWAVTCAEYDAAVRAQLTAAKMDRTTTAMVVHNIRGNRRPILASATAPLELNPIVSSRTHQPIMQARLGGKRWQWDMDTTRQHARHVLEVSLGADMDAQYFRFLRDCNLEEDIARHYVTGLREYMASYNPPSAG